MARSSKAFACWRRATSSACWKQASRLADIGKRELEEQLPPEPIHLRLPPPLLGRGDQCHGFRQDRHPGLRLPRLARRLRQQAEKIGAVQLVPGPLEPLEPRLEVDHARRRVPLHGQRPPQQEPSVHDTVRQAVRRGEGNQRLRVGGGRRRVPTELCEDGTIHVGIRQTGRIPDC